MQLSLRSAPINKILSALYCLGAESPPVTARQVTDLLNLHFGKKVPINVNGSLRAYSAYVQPQKGTRLLWSLTPKGIEKLRSVSGLPLSSQSDSANFGTDRHHMRP